MTLAAIISIARYWLSSQAVRRFGTSGAHRWVARIHDAMQEPMLLHDSGTFSRSLEFVEPAAFVIVPSPVIDTNRQFYFGAGDGSSRIPGRSAGSLSAVGRSHKRRRFFFDLLSWLPALPLARQSGTRRRSGHLRGCRRRDSRPSLGLAFRSPGCGRSAWRHRGRCRRARSGIAAVSLCAARATPIETVTRPRCSPVERFISSLVITARRM